MFLFKHNEICYIDKKRNATKRISTGKRERTMSLNSTMPHFLKGKKEPIGQLAD